jgi:hypothetical protein
LWLFFEEGRRRQTIAGDFKVARVAPCNRSS